MILAMCFLFGLYCLIRAYCGGSLFACEKAGEYFFGKSRRKQKGTLDRGAKVSYNSVIIMETHICRGVSLFHQLYIQEAPLWHLVWKPVPILLSILR